MRDGTFGFSSSIPAVLELGSSVFLSSTYIIHQAVCTRRSYQVVVDIVYGVEVRVEGKCHFQRRDK